MDEDFQTIELYYTKEATANDKERQIPIMSRDQVVKTLDIQTETESDLDHIEQLNLKILFFQEGKVNNLAIRFQYSFTQNLSLENDAVHFKYIDKHIRVRSQSPFKVDWQVKSADAFLVSLQHFYTSQLGATD